MIVGYTEELEEENLKDDVVLIWDLISSENYEEYGICASGIKYKALYDGYVVVIYEANEENKGTSFSITVNDLVSSYSHVESNSGIPSSVFLPVAKDNMFKVYYTKSKPTYIRIYKAKKFN